MMWRPVAAVASRLLEHVISANYKQWQVRTCTHVCWIDMATSAAVGMFGLCLACEASPSMNPVSPVKKTFHRPGLPCNLDIAPTARTECLYLALVNTIFESPLYEVFSSENVDWKLISDPDHIQFSFEIAFTTLPHRYLMPTVGFVKYYTCERFQMK